MIADASAAQRLFLDGVTGGSSALMMARPLILDHMTWMAVFIHQQEIDAFGVDAAIGIRLFASENFAKRNLRHHLPVGIAGQNHAIQLPKHARFPFVEERLNREIGIHDDPQLRSGIK